MSVLTDSKSLRYLLLEEESRAEAQENPDSGHGARWRKETFVRSNHCHDRNHPQGKNGSDEGTQQIPTASDVTTLNEQEVYRHFPK